MNEPMVALDPLASLKRLLSNSQASFDYAMSDKCGCKTCDSLRKMMVDIALVTSVLPSFLKEVTNSLKTISELDA